MKESNVKAAVFFNAFIEDESNSKVQVAQGLKIEKVAVPGTRVLEMKREVAAKGYAAINLESGRQAVVTKELNRGVFK